jgi:putative addiction module component (TIGR02574 family)
MSKLQLIQQEILSLTDDEKELISIFIKDTIAETASTSDYNDAWKKELNMRLNDVQSGAIKGIKTEDAIAEIRAKLKK